MSARRTPYTHAAAVWNETHSQAVVVSIDHAELQQQCPTQKYEYSSYPRVSLDDRPKIGAWCCSLDEKRSLPYVAL